ncbi:hypothetical protein [Dactylosporangium sp. NPDC050588]|uniref:hypothetical protein n=1 Tax=Dactylosporangium sp. NPDC050588 TaxID=3157211 RepID=UPI00340CBCE0
MPTGVVGDLKNLIFAANGPNRRSSSVTRSTNDLDIVENEQYCLVYDRPLGPNGLTWKELIDWWADREGLTGRSSTDVSRSLYSRLDQSLRGNDAERRILRTYAEQYVRFGSDIPALIPQVYTTPPENSAAGYVERM